MQRRVDYVLATFAVICAWAVLRVFGAERARRVHDMTVKAYLNRSSQLPANPALPEKSPAPALPSQQPAVRSKPGR